MSEEEARHLDAELTEIKRLLKRVLKVVDKPKKPIYAFTQVQVAERLAEACQLKGLSKRCAISRRTIQRMESGDAPARAGYCAAVRLNEATLLSWLRAYVQEELCKLNPDYAVSYNDGLIGHQPR